MTPDSQHPLPSHLPFYRRRKFWGVTYIFILLFSTFIFFQYAGDGILYFGQAIDLLNISFGGTLFFLIGDALGVSLLITLIYYLMIAFCIYKTMQYKVVLLMYPTTLLLLYLSGLYASFVLMSAM